MGVPLPGGRARGPQGSLTWLFYHIQDGLPTGVFIVLESDDTVILILVCTIHGIPATVPWGAGEERVSSWKTGPPPKPSHRVTGKVCNRKPSV